MLGHDDIDIAALDRDEARHADRGNNARGWQHQHGKASGRNLRGAQEIVDAAEARAQTTLLDLAVRLSEQIDLERRVERNEFLNIAQSFRAMRQRDRSERNA